MSPTGASPRSAWLVAVWSAIQAAMYPERGCDAGGRRALDEDARESNGRLMRWYAVVGVLTNALPVVVLLRRTEADPAGDAWVLWLIRLSAVLAAYWIVVMIVAWRRRPAVLWGALGDVVGVLSLLGAAAKSANAQRAHPSITVFVTAAFLTAFFLRIRPWVYVPALLGASAVVLLGIARLQQQDGTARFADALALLAISALALLGFFVARSLRVRGFLAQRQLELVNEELGRRVEEQQRDIAERKRVEEALREANVAADAANRAKGAFLANMSHELRTPMNAVLGHTQLLQQNPGLSREQQAHLEVIRRSGDHLLELMNNVLEMSRLEAGVGEHLRADVDLHRLLGDLERTFRHRAREKRLSFDLHEGPGVPPHLLGDERRLHQVLVNLLDNAVKFTEQGGVVVRALVREAAAGDARLVVEVEDTGVGIAAEKVGELFQPFAQLRVGIDAQGGAGLGLAMSRDFAQRMGGDLTVESHAGVGSVFRLEIGLTVVEAPQPEPVRAAAASVPDPDALLREHATALPPELLAEISEALRAADYERLIGLTGRFPPERAAVGEALRALVEQYRYEDIAAALEVRAPGERAKA